MTPDRLALIVLAAGRSSRFGTNDKLMADLGGRPVGLHTPERLMRFDWAQRLTVAQGVISGHLESIGFTCLPPEMPEAGMGDNLALAARNLAEVDAALIVLADMPFVSEAHIASLLKAASGPSAMVASEAEGRWSPPVLFGRDHFGALCALSGDDGARALLKSQPDRVISVPVSPEALFDIDTPEALDEARLLV